MDNLQYEEIQYAGNDKLKSFKPYYKWITFNTYEEIQYAGNDSLSFKPYYKWITFNTESSVNYRTQCKKVLNLIING